jgi:hypothetical protein
LRVDRGVLLSNHSGTATAYTVGVSAIHLERNPDRSISGGSTYIETTGIKHDTASTYEWTPYDENESCSSFVMKEVVASNTLVINYRSAEARTYPIFRVAE